MHLRFKLPYKPPVIMPEPISDNQQTVTLSFFRYPFGQRRWGMKQMWEARAKMRAMPGIQFFKPLGTGGGQGFSIFPDFTTYGILGVWESEAHANAFLTSGYFSELSGHSSEQYTIFLHPLASHGSWSGFSNWSLASEVKGSDDIVAAITCAKLKFRFLWKFWSMVPRASKGLEGAKGLIFSRGIGELPLVEQATFSIWKDLESMKQFAYQTFHGKAVAETRKRKGFREEMFTRLRPFRTSGSWCGKDPLQAHLHTPERNS
jgi:heme-degrading monooxygenase HmoA